MSEHDNAMDRHARIYVAGHRGMVGKAIVRQLEALGYDNLLLRTRDDLDLTEQAEVRRFFAETKPHYVFQCAAKVGGIWANDTQPAQFIHQNLAIQTNIIHESWRHGVDRLLFLGSSCIYPRACPQPMAEEHLLTGPLEKTNRPYAVAKIAGIEMCWSYNREYGTRYLAAMPTNLYGPGDNFDPVTSHVLPALVGKMHEAVEQGAEAVTLWGTGSPRREFLYSEDLAEACVHLMNTDDSTYGALLDAPGLPPLVNVGCGEDITIRSLAELVQRLVGFQGRLDWDTSKPDGTPRKLLDVSRIRATGWSPRTGLEEGIQRLHAAYIAQRAPTG